MLVHSRSASVVGQGEAEAWANWPASLVNQGNLDSVRNSASKRKVEKILEDSECQPFTAHLHTYTPHVNKCKYTHFTFLKTKSHWGAREMTQWSSVQTSLTGTQIQFPYKVVHSL